MHPITTNVLSTKINPATGFNDKMEVKTKVLAPKLLNPSGKRTVRPLDADIDGFLASQKVSRVDNVLHAQQALENDATTAAATTTATTKNPDGIPSSSSSSHDGVRVQLKKNIVPTSCTTGRTRKPKKSIINKTPSNRKIEFRSSSSSSSMNVLQQRNNLHRRTNACMSLQEYFPKIFDGSVAIEM